MVTVNPTADNYIVICLDQDDAGFLRYHLATRRIFLTWDEAERYRKTVAETRNPLVVTGRFLQLRIHAE